MVEFIFFWSVLKSLIRFVEMMIREFLDRLW